MLCSDSGIKVISKKYRMGDFFMRKRDAAKRILVLLLAFVAFALDVTGSAV